MPHYMFKASYTREGLQGILDVSQIGPHEPDELRALAVLRGNAVDFLLGQQTIRRASRNGHPTTFTVILAAS